MGQEESKELFEEPILNTLRADEPLIPTSNDNDIKTHHLQPSTGSLKNRLTEVPEDSIDANPNANAPNPPNPVHSASSKPPIPSYQDRLNKTQRSNLRNKSAVDEEENGPEIDDEELNEEKMWIEAIGQDPKSSHLRNQLANHYFSRNRLKEAEFAYKAAISLDATNAIAHYDFAFMRHHQFYWALSKFR